MSSINLSAGFESGMIPRLFRLTNGVDTGPSIDPALVGLLNGGLSNDSSISVAAALYLMKGNAPPNVNILTKLDDRLSDILCQFKTGNNSPGNLIGTDININPAIISTEYVEAIATGVATWFWWIVTKSQNNALLTNESFVHSAYGTIGSIATNADLELVDVNIVTGQEYRITGLQLHIPTSWTY